MLSSEPSHARGLALFCFCFLLLFVCLFCFGFVLVGCCFTSTETVGLLGTGTQNGHLDFHTAPELRPALWPWTCRYRSMGPCFGPQLEGKGPNQANQWWADLRIMLNCWLPHVINARRAVRQNGTHAHFWLRFVTGTVSTVPISALVGNRHCSTR